MPDNSRVMQLLELALDSGSTPEVVCADFPELLPQVRQQWEKCRCIEAHIDDLFPSSQASMTDASIHALLEPINLPDIPGYQVQAILGRGGMGIVYKALQLRLNRTIALKMLLSGAYAGRVERARFQREAQAIAGLRHAHIVQVHDAGEYDGRPYFTMELVEGTNLAVKLAGIPQPARKAAAMLELLANATESAHENGIIHRDLKPANILLATNGTPKIGDFGLARHFEGEDTLTISGARVGTPSYMAPEQVDNRTGAVGPAADVYALGAILYEMLTGRPPFRGESAAETERQLIAEDPVPPSKLNARVPRDLETICLKCLQKEPRRRYITAGDLAADLGRFQRGEPVSARRITVLERAIKWARRRPARATVIVASFIVITLLSAGLLKVLSDRAANTQTIKEDLRDVAGLQQRSSWSQADAALERTKAHLEARYIPLYLHRQFEQAQRASKLAADLEAIRQDHAGSKGRLLNFNKSDKDYAKTFADAGIGTTADDPSIVAARIRASSVCPALIEALNDWSFCINPRPEADWILAVVRQADVDPTGWRTAIRDPKVWNDGVVLEQSLAHISVAEQPVGFLLAVAHRLQDQKRESLPLLTQIQQAHAGDLWANLELAKELYAKQNWSDAMRFFQATQALKPDQPYVLVYIGRCLAQLNRSEDAIRQYALAIRADPAAVPALGNLAVQLMASKRPAEAIPFLRRAIALMPPEPMLYSDLGECLDLTGQSTQAIEAYQQALKLEDPNHPLAGLRTKLRVDLMTANRLNEARKVWRDAIRLEPNDHSAWDGYAECCLYLGDEKEYRKNCDALMDHFENESYSRFCEQTSRACMLLPSSPQLLRRATTLIDRALKSPTEDDAIYKPYFEVTKGLALYRVGQYDDSLKLLTGRAGTVLGPMPTLICAMNWYRKGDMGAARTLLASAVISFDWRPSQANSRESWLYHILRREAESLIVPRADDFLRSAYQPTINAERMALVATCQSKNLLGAGANLWSEIFQSDPDLGLGNRSACYAMAALAGSGAGDDAAKFNDEDRRRWRQLARQWLLNDIAHFEADLTRNTGSKTAARFAMDNALILPDLAGIRDADKLSQLSPDEQRECDALWTKVRALRDRLPATN